ncbi:DUF1439 domain-containing protein [Vibrio sp. HN007]|uniref:DUF1439 domain-containing protein n=1 Tax=Vibrio iocasae TaxID=3098914 RepID=UPI0035D47C39
MLIKQLKTLLLPLTLLTLGGCASYSISEQEMTDYLQENVALEQSVGIENVMYAQVAVDDLNIKIGRADAERISVFANTNAKVTLLSSQNLGLDLDIEFSAIPEYNKESGEIFLKSLRLEKFEEKNKQLTPEIERFLKPAVSMLGSALSNQPVYKLDSNKVQEAMLKSTNPNLVIKDHKLVIELFD